MFGCLMKTLKLLSFYGSYMNAKEKILKSISEVLSAKKIELKNTIHCITDQHSGSRMFLEVGIRLK